MGDFAWLPEAREDPMICAAGGERRSRGRPRASFRPATALSSSDGTKISIAERDPSGKQRDRNGRKRETSDIWFRLFVASRGPFFGSPRAARIFPTPADH
jgi:hypothetical protein